MATSKTTKTTKKATTTKKTATTATKKATTSTKPKTTPKTRVNVVGSASSLVPKDTKILVIVESPNKCHSLDELFKKMGYTHATVEASVGHITQIKNSRATVWNTGVHPEDNFKIDFEVAPEKKKVVTKLKELVKANDLVLIATDPDREGSSIATHLKEELHIPASKYYRLTYNEITLSAVQNGMDNLAKIDAYLSIAADARQAVDILFGFGLTNIFKNAVNAYSVGRCQSPAVRIIVEREREIINFVPETYFDLYLDFTKNSHEYTAKYYGTDEAPLEGGHFKNEADLNKVMSECKTYPYTINSIEANDRKVSQPTPFTTTTFQQEASSRLGFSVKSAMDYAQSLFHGVEINGERKGLITYIRTDSSTMAPEFIDILESHVKTQYGADYYAPIKKSKAKSAVASQEAHECLRVTDVTMTPKKFARYATDAGMLKIYTLIYDRTIASSMAPQVITDVDYNIYNLQNKFVLTTHSEKFDGFKKVYNEFPLRSETDEPIKKDDSESELTNATRDLHQGDSIPQKTSSLRSEKKQTTPPPRLNEARLVATLEKLGIGRPSTMSTIVSTITDSKRHYVISQGTGKNQVFVPTQEGFKMVEYGEQNFPDLFNYSYTARLEESLDKIAHNELDYLQFMNEFYTDLCAQMEKAAPGSSTRKSSGVSEKIKGEKCPLCGGQLVFRRGKFGPFVGCSNYAQGCRYIQKL